MRKKLGSGITLAIMCLALWLGAGSSPAQAGVIVAPPSNLTVEVTPNKWINLEWQNNATNHTSFTIQALKIDEFDDVVGNWGDIAWTVESKVTRLSLDTDELDWFDEKGHGMRFRVGANHPDQDPIHPYSDEVTVRLYDLNLVYTIDHPSYSLNGVISRMDAAPMIIQGRTMLPIRYVADPLKAEAVWNGAESKVTVKTAEKTIEMWLNNNTAQVNGVPVRIDPNNPGVVPISIPPGRTMLPLRFIADNLDCQVTWVPEKSQVVIHESVQR